MPTLKVMTWNVENLFHPADDASAEEQQRFQTKLANLAAVIDREQPDVLALQEIGPADALTALQQSLAAPMPHSRSGEPDRRGIRVEGERYRYAAYALYRRTGESVTIRERVNKVLAPGDGSLEPEDGLGRSKAVIVCGDLNDETDAATTQILQGPAGSEIRTSGFSHGDKGDAYRLWNLAPLLNQGPDGAPPAEPPYTRVFKGRGELIDHIFASHRLVNPDNLPEARTVPAGEGLPSVTEEPGERGGDPASDHAAVVATFGV